MNHKVIVYEYLQHTTYTIFAYNTSICYLVIGTKKNQYLHLYFEMFM